MMFSNFGTYNLYDIPGLKNAYFLRGNIADVRHWHGAECFKPAPIRKINPPAKQVNMNRRKHRKTGRCLWYRPVIQCEYRKAERIDMAINFEKEGIFTLVSKNGRYIKNDPATMKELEHIARKQKENNWTIEIIGAFEELVYQRQGMNKWLLVGIGKGYA